MNKLIISAICFSFLFYGCAGGSDPYPLYISAKKTQAVAERKPLIELELTDDGKVKRLAMFPAPVPIIIEQKKDHPIYALGSSVVKIFGLVGAIWQTGEAIEGIVEASTGNSTYMNSYNNNSENSGSIESITDYSDAKTDVLTTDVETSE